MVVDVEVGILNGVDMMQPHIVARQPGQRGEQLAARARQTALRGRERGRTQNAVGRRLERDPHGLCLAYLYVVDIECEEAVPARPLEAGTPGLAAHALIRQQRPRESGLDAREHPDHAERRRAEAERLRVHGGGVLHHAPEKGRLCDAAVVDVAVADLIFTGKKLDHGKHLRKIRRKDLR